MLFFVMSFVCRYLKQMYQNSDPMVEIFKKLIFFSMKKTQTFNQKLNHKHNYYIQTDMNGVSKVNSQRLFHFEAKLFQCCLLQNRIRFIKDYKQNKEYLIFKFGHSRRLNQKEYHKLIHNSGNHDHNQISKYVALYGICEHNNRFPKCQPWHCRSITTLDGMKNHFDIDNAQFKSIMSLSNTHGPIYKKYDSMLSYTLNLKQIRAQLMHGFEQYSRSNGYVPRKQSIETKYDYLNKICQMMKINRYYLLHNKISDAIEGAFQFAQQHPETALTQMYVNETECKIGYELVLLAEIADLDNNQFYKFGVPIGKHQKCDRQRANSSQWYYIARTILTPFMAVNNIRLNLIANGGYVGNDRDCGCHSFGCKDDNCNHDCKNWLESISDHNISFYMQIDPYWYCDDNRAVH